MKNNVLLLIFLLLSCKNQDGPQPANLSQIILKDFFVVSIAFDKSGNTWLGTLNQGLVKYDGKAATVYNSSNSPLTNAAIRDIKLDKAGNIWIASANLVKFDGMTFTTFDSKNFGLPPNHVKSIAIDASDRIWFECSSFKSGGLVKYDGKTFTAYTPENSDLPGNMIQSLTIDKQNNVWLAINDGVSNFSLVKISGNQWNIFGSKELGFTPYYFGNLLINKQDDLIASLNYGLSSTIVPNRPQIFKFDGNQTEIVKLPDEDVTVYFTERIFMDTKDQLWASFSSGKECGIYKNNQWIFKNLGTGGIFAFGESPAGAIWLGTGKGVYVMK